MIRLALCVAALALAACSPQPPQAAASDLQDCGSVERTGVLTPVECQFEAGSRVVRVRFAAPAAGEDGGTVEVLVPTDDGGEQQLVEHNVYENLTPTFEDIDGDGRADILIPRVQGNVNTEYGVWIFDGQRYNRVGEVNGVEFERTAEGYVAVSARSSAAAWAINFYRLDQARLIPLVELYIEATGVTDDGHVTGKTCRISEAPGLAELNLTMEAARAKFCAEPIAAQVFGT